MLDQLHNLQCIGNYYLVHVCARWELSNHLNPSVCLSVMSVIFINENLDLHTWYKQQKQLSMYLMEVKVGLLPLFLATIHNVGSALRF